LDIPVSGMKIAVFGATSSLGRELVARLLVDGHAVVAIGRDAGRLRDSVRAPVERRVADLRHPATLAATLLDVEMAVSVAHARFVPALLDALPAGCGRVVLLGSARRFSRFPDRAAEAVRSAEAALAVSGRSGVMLHPTMIYGWPGDRTVRRILDYLCHWPGWLPIPVPLPRAGRTLVQPIFAEDVVRALHMALVRPEAVGDAIVIAGPEPISIIDLVRTCALAVGRRVFIVPLPQVALRASIRFAAGLGFKPYLSLSEIERLIENKHFDVGAMRRRLGIEPVALAEGLDRRNYSDFATDANVTGRAAE